jgi:hypothetical protein
LLIGLGLVAATGCGPSTAKLSGKVTYKGTALKGGTVTFIPDGSGETFSTTIQEDGSYAFQQIKTGKYKVCVDTASVKPGGATTGPAYAGKAAGAVDKSKIKNTPPPDANVPEGYRTVDPFSGAAEAAKRYTPIPPEYGKPETTKLTYEVKGGAQQYDIPLD